MLGRSDSSDELYELIDNYHGPTNSEHTENQPDDESDADGTR